MAPTVAALAAQKLRRTLGLEPRRWPTPGAMAADLDYTTLATPALDLIDQALVDVADGRCDRLMIFMPPQEGKSERVSRRFPLWLLAENPDLRVAIVSYADEMARRWGAEIKSDVLVNAGDEDTIDLGIRLREDSRAAGRWHIAGHRGSVYCVGVAGSLTGKPVDVMVVDDPIKDLEQANSPVYRERAQRFWQGVAVPRLGPGARVVLIQTRWHEDDLAGWLLKQEPGRWRVLSIPALAESDDDPLGRPVGEAMISARGNRDWAAIRRSVGEYVWAALYQQRPAPAEGGMFRRTAWKHWTPQYAQRIDLAGRAVDLRDCWRFATVDLAASTRTSADWSVCSVWAIAPGGDALILLDRARARIGETEHWSLVRPLRERWAADVVFVEKSMLGTTLVRDAVRAGVPVSDVDPDRDKISRAIPAAARVDAGTVWLPAGAGWLAEWVDEHATFPNGAHDDQVDTLAYAVRVAVARWNPMPADVSQIAHLRQAPDAEIDFMTQAM